MKPIELYSWVGYMAGYKWHDVTQEEVEKLIIATWEKCDFNVHKKEDLINSMQQVVKNYNVRKFIEKRLGIKAE